MGYIIQCPSPGQISQIPKSLKTSSLAYPCSLFLQTQNTPPRGPDANYFIPTAQHPNDGIENDHRQHPLQERIGRRCGNVQATEALRGTAIYSFLPIVWRLRFEVNRQFHELWNLGSWHLTFNMTSRSSGFVCLLRWMFMVDPIFDWRPTTGLDSFFCSVFASLVWFGLLVKIILLFSLCWMHLF